MSGVKNLAAAVATDPSFMSKVTGFTRAELAQTVAPGKSGGPKSKPPGSKKY